MLETARVQGSGAGMEPPADAVKRGRFYEWRPGLHVPELVLRQSAPGGEWRLCTGEGCATLSSHLPGADPIRMAPCN